MTDTNHDESVTTETTEQSTAPSYKELLEQIRNEQGEPKYRSVEDALKGTQHAQDHIRNLEDENHKIKEEYSRMEELVNQLSGKTESQTKTEEGVATTTSTESPKSGDSSAINEDEILEKLMAKMSANQKAATEERNKQEALEKVQSVYADKAAETMKAKAEELGVSTDYLLNLAATSPKVFYNTLGLNAKPRQSNDWSSSSMNSSAFSEHKNKPAFEGKPMHNTRDAIKYWDEYC